VKIIKKTSLEKSVEIFSMKNDPEMAKLERFRESKLSCDRPV